MCFVQGTCFQPFKRPLGNGLSNKDSDSFSAHCGSFSYAEVLNQLEPNRAADTCHGADDHDVLRAFTRLEFIPSTAQRKKTDAPRIF